jgi:mono/diheme cytochrome c family protein
MHFHSRRTRVLPLNSQTVAGVLLCAIGFASQVFGAGAGASSLSPSDAQVQAIFDRNCIKCHGPLEHKSDLELDSREGQLRGNADGPVVVAGQPAKSKLIAALAPDADPHMPPHKQLSDQEIATLRAWIVALPALAMAKNGKTTARPALELKKVPAEPTSAIDYILAASWKRDALTSARVCDDGTFVRRIYLDLAGRIPTQAEARAFVSDKKADKRARLADALLASEEEYPRTFREIWDALLMTRHTDWREDRRHDNGWFAFLEDAFRRDRPWNEVVRDMIVARPDSTITNGAVWFLFERNNEPQKVAEALAPVIYGTRVDCAQCHDHPLAREIKQAHYWGLVAAFNRSKNVEKGLPGVSESGSGGFVNFTNLRKESQRATMCLFTGQSIEEAWPAPDGKTEDKPEHYLDPDARVKVPKFSRRFELAKAVTENNPLLARSFVNYTWAILLGRGIVQPVDEMNSKHPPSQPELLDWLAKDFATHAYQTRRLVRAIVLSRAYQLAAWSGPKPPPAESFAAALEKPLTAETIARSARIASGRSANDPKLRRAFAEAFPEVLPRSARATIQQSLFLANSETFSGLFAPDAGTAPDRLGRLPQVSDRVFQAFALALSRAPAPVELAEGTKFLRAHDATPGQAAGDLLWSLVAGPEFLTNH